MRIVEVLTSPFLSRGSDAALLLMRLTVGSFLIFGVWDNITSAERMTEFELFLEKFGFPLPKLMAPLSVWAQFNCGLAFILGFATRWAGLICAFNFVVAIAMVDHHQGIRGAFPSACLVVIGLYLATHGPGRLALDNLITPLTHGTR
ncbi:MAG: DoxX family protein [Pseudomonadota bacterium]